MKVKQTATTVILTVEKGIATEMADCLVKQGYNVTEVIKPVDKRKADILIAKPLDNDKMDDSLRDMVEAAAHTALNRLFEQFKEN